MYVRVQLGRVCTVIGDKLRLVYKLCHSVAISANHDRGPGPRVSCASGPLSLRYRSPTSTYDVAPLLGCCCMLWGVGESGGVLHCCRRGTARTHRCSARTLRSGCGLRMRSCDG